MSFSWKSLIASVAPVLGTALGGPFGGMATSAALKALGVTPEEGKEETQLARAMQNATPEDLLKIKQCDQQFQKDMKALDVDIAKLDGQDRASARDMATKAGALPQIILSSIYTVAYSFVMYAFMTGQVHVADSQQVLFGSLIGILTAAQVQILNFWFGSSHGSQKKTDLMVVK